MLPCLLCGFQRLAASPGFQLVPTPGCNYPALSRGGERGAEEEGRR